MSSAVVKYGVASVLLLLAGVPIGYFVKGNLQTPVVPDAPAVDVSAIEVAVGELVQLKAEGTNAAWTVEPASPDAISFGNENEHFVASFRTSARYVVINACVVDGKVTIQKTFYDVTGGGAAPGNNLSAEFRQWGVGPSPATVAATFRTVASFVDEKTKAGALVQPEEILTMTTDSNKRALGADNSKWNNFFSRLEDKLKSLQDSGQLVSQRDYIRVWNDIADALGTL
jgi:hypothetical protein